jgi:low affinity Fe/Cu permease
MENLQLITATVLITLISGALVGSLIYLGVVVRKLRRTVNNNVVDITNLQNVLNEEIQNVYGRMDVISRETEDRLKELSDWCNHNSSEMDRKIDSRYDKLSSNTSYLYDEISREVERRSENLSSDISDLIKKVNTTETYLLNKISGLEEVKTKQ